jgi:endo-1,4-beta-xylanase
MRWTYLVTGLLVRASTGVEAQSQAQGLHSLFVASGKLFFGTATDTNLFNDIPYMKIANNSKEFGLRVPENSQKWQPTEPNANKFVFANPDQVALTSKANGQMIRCHTLTWHSQLPDFSKSSPPRHDPRREKTNQRKQSKQQPGHGQPSPQPSKPTSPT